jgi:hypothetical protein
MGSNCLVFLSEHTTFFICLVLVLDQGCIAGRGTYVDVWLRCGYVGYMEDP